MRATRWGVGLAAAGALVAATLARPPRRADAGTVGGELTISPRTPRGGDTLVFSYRAGAVLAGASRLHLRAAYHPDDDVRPTSRPVRTVAVLFRATDDVYRARVVLPPGVAYAEFSVEDPDGRDVDAHGGEPWDVIVADTTGRPRMGGIRSQGMAAAPGAWEHTRLVALGATRVYPDHPSGWWVRTQQDVELAGAARQDSVVTAARPLVARLDTALTAATARGERAESWAMLDLAHLASFAGLPAVDARWRARLLADAPRSVAAYTERVTGLWAAKAPPSAQLDSLERWWRADGDSLSLFLGQAVGLAVAAHDTAAAKRWAARAVAADVASTLFVARQLAADPALAADAVGYARAVIARATASQGPAAAARPITSDQAHWRRARAQEGREAYAVEGKGLLALHDARGAVGALARATAGGWDADAFRQLGEARLALGDTLGATAAYAHAVADPVLGPGLFRALATRLGRHTSGAAWARQVDGARHTMAVRVAADLLAQPVRADVRLADANGRHEGLSALHAGRVAVLALMSSTCGPALGDAAALEQLATTLRQRSVPVIVVTHDRPVAGASAPLRARGLTAPLWYDVDGDLASVLDVRGTPTYVVLDPEGTVRWRGHRAREASTVAGALLDAAQASRPGPGGDGVS